MSGTEERSEGELTANEHIDEPVRLARERGDQVEEEAAKIRATLVPRETEPPTTYRP